MSHRIILIVSILLAGAAAAHPADANAAEPVTAALDSLGALISDGAYDQAIAGAEELLVRVESDYGGESLETAHALDLLVRGLPLAGRAAEPRTAELGRRAVAIKEKLLGPDHLDTAVTLYWLASVERNCGRLAESISLLERVREIRVRELGPDDPLVGDVEGSLGIALAMSGQLTEARGHFERAVAITEAAEGPEAQELGGGYTNLATLYTMLGDLPAAEAAIGRAITVNEHNYGPNHPTVGKTVYTMATIHLTRGDVRAAAVDLERVRAIQAANGMAEHPSAASVWNGLGLVAQSLGDYPRAVECFSEGLRIYEKAYGTDNQDLCYYLDNLGIAAQQDGNEDLAREALERSVAIAIDRLGADNVRTANSMYFLAKFELRRGDYQAAAARIEQCLPVFTAELGEDHHRTAEALGDLARARELDGMYAESELLLDRALAGSGGHVNPVVQASLQLNLARVHLRQGRFAESCSEALAVEDAATDQYRLVIQTLSENVARRFATARVNGAAVALTALLAGEPDPDQAILAWDRMIRSRGMLLDELAARRRLVTTADDAETRRLADDVFAARSRLADMYVRGTADRSAERFASVLADARNAKQAAEAALATRSTAFRSAVADRELGIAEVRAALPSGAALVAFQRFVRVDEATDVPWYCAFVMSGDRVDVVDLGPAGAIDDLIGAWRTGLLDAWAADGVLAEPGIAANREIGARLRAKVWDPCAALVADAGTVFVVPDGNLHLLPLAALPATGGGYLLEHGPAFHYLGREKGLVRGDHESGQGVLALGDPSFDGRTAPSVVATLAAADMPALQGILRGTPPDCEQVQALRFGALPGTRQECQDVANLAGGDAHILLGDQATEAAFKAELAGHRIVHLATHGFFVGADCPGQTTGFADDPLLMAGLALAGANRRAEAGPGVEDGIVTAEEISLLDLAGVEWAVLSACDTGLGVLQPGEGVYGLQRAFATAGVGTVIMSLWPVEDQVTRQWMAELYRARLVEGRTTPAALRQAALAVLHERRDAGLSVHPFWWGGFVAAGDWR